MSSSTAALDHLLADQCSISEEGRRDFSNPFAVLFSICMTPVFMFVAAKAKERWQQILQGTLSSVASVGSFATNRCKVSRKMPDASYEQIADRPLFINTTPHTNPRSAQTKSDLVSRSGARGDPKDVELGDGPREVRASPREM